MLSSDIYRKARLSRDPRFDGTFFTAVKTTGIYCRTICPVRPPKEENVEYFLTAIEAAQAGYRPCLRCRPDSAPGSPAWRGVNTTLDRATKLLNEGYLQEASLTELALRLGISDRYLRKLFHEHLGVSPKRYALYQQCLFAKKLLHETQLPITQVALASGFESIRRFNDCFKSQLNLTPSQMRKSRHTSTTSTLSLNLSYRPPLDWPRMQGFLQNRCIEGLEWCNTTSYGRTFIIQGVKGKFTAHHCSTAHRFTVDIEVEDIKILSTVVNTIRRILDLDVDIQQVEKDLSGLLGPDFPLTSGLRLPGIWSLFEAGVRAILGQQITVLSAKKLVETLVNTLGEKDNGTIYFPTPQAIYNSNLAFLKMPQSRKETLRRFSEYMATSKAPENTEHWQSIKGIGPWTIRYARLRGLSDPDVQLEGDAGIKKALSRLPETLHYADASPWRSYLTLQLWNTL